MVLPVCHDLIVLLESRLPIFPETDLAFAELEIPALLGLPEERLWSASHRTTSFLCVTLLYSEVVVASQVGAARFELATSCSQNDFRRPPKSPFFSGFSAILPV